MANALEELAAAEAMYTGAHMSAMPTLQSGEKARPQAPPQVFRSTQPAHQQHRTLRGSQRNHPAAYPATSNNAYPGDRSSHEVLAANWQLQVGTLYTGSTQQRPLPHTIPRFNPYVAAGHNYFSAPDTSDVYSLAASSPQCDYKYHHSNLSPSLLETHMSHFMSLQPPETMQTPPVSAHPSPNNTAMDDQPSRKRSHSVMSNEQGFKQQLIAAATTTTTAHDDLPDGHRQATRSESVISGGVEIEGYPGRGSRAFKRGDPPQNEHGKYICDYTEDCRDVTFDRKCEWSKHMDKHDRPYRCPHQSCGKLQGFTYSGGLLRHEREVHGKHGGPKAQLMCPHADCKRHAGKGFTRKENLNEHLRRVHFSRSPDAHDIGLGADDDGIEVDSATQEAIAALGASHQMKRKRSLLGSNGDPSDIVLLRQEIAMLQAENDRKDAVIQDLTQQLAHEQRSHEPNVPESISSYQQT